MKKKGVAGIITAIVIMLLMTILPTNDHVTRAGLYAMGIFLSAIVMWICDSMPMCVTAILAIFMLSVFKVLPLSGDGSVDYLFGGTAFFFAIATFAVSIALENTCVPLKICSAMTKLSKGNSKILVVVLLLATGITSSVMSNLSTCIIYMNLGLALIQANKCKPGESGLAKCLMIGIPCCAGVGGLITPAGTPGNILIMQLLSENTGINISFAQWILLMAPLAIISILMLGIWETIVFKPEKISDEAMHELNAKLEEHGKLTVKEWKTMIIIAAMLIFWILGTWIKAFDTTLVAVCGMVLLFMPGIQVLDWKKTSNRINWNLCFTIGSVGVLVAGLNVTGIMNYIVNQIFSGLTGMNIMLAFIIISFVVCIIRAFIPTAPAIAALFGAPLLALAPVLGVSAVALLFIPAFWACTPTLLWIEPIFLFTYGYGYYKPQDVLKFGSVPTLILIAVMAFLPMYVGMLGF